MNEVPSLGDLQAQQEKLIREMAQEIARLRDEQNAAMDRLQDELQEHATAQYMVLKHGRRKNVRWIDFRTGWAADRTIRISFHMLDDDYAASAAGVDTAVSMEHVQSGLCCRFNRPPRPEMLVAMLDVWLKTA